LQRDSCAKIVFEFTPQFKLLIAGNHKPGLRTVDEAMRRRLNLLPFTVTIPASERDVKLTEKLRSKWGGILKWMIDGCSAYQRWCEWCGSNGEHVGTQKRFSQTLEARGFTRQRTSTARGFAGIGLRTDVTDVTGCPHITVTRARA
jgi:putative DNA primase/helicase